MSALKNNQVIDINLQETTYELQLAVKNTFFEAWDNCFFTLVERDTEEWLVLSSVTAEQREDVTVFNVYLPFDAHAQTFMKRDIWDVYLNGQTEDDERRIRAKNTSSQYRFLVVDLPDQAKMFYPYPTKNGKLSFRFNHYFLYAELDEVSLKKDQLSFSGYFNYPPLFKTSDSDVEDLRLVVTNNRDDQETVVPVERMQRGDIQQKAEGNNELLYCGFTGSFNFSHMLNNDRKVYLKYYLEMTLNTNSWRETIRSTRVRLDKSAGIQPTRVIQSVNAEKKKILLKPTKRSYYASLQITRFYRRKEMVRQLKSAWVRVRRSNVLKNWYKLAFSLLGKLPAKKKTIMFESFIGKQYSDSPRAIYEYMLTHKPDYEMYWSVDRRHMPLFEDKHVRHVRRFSIKWLFLMARAGFWVSNSRLPLWIPKPKHTTYLQTWHGTPLKRLATDMDEVHMPGTNAEKYKRNFLKATAKWDYLVSPNAYSTEIFRRAFQFDRTMIESGYPRNDFLINANNAGTISDLKHKINIPEDKRVILYAPTWRDNQFYGRGQYKFDLQLDLDRLHEELGEDTIVLLRLHYLVAENLDLTGYDHFVFDVSAHEDIRELYLVSDMLITDYSSVFFDYANLRRPMFFYVYDIEDYRDNLRGFYFDLEAKAPGPLVKTTEALLQEIKSIDQHGFEPSATTQAFYDKFCYLEDGRASERVVNQLF
ncbi:teichoic acid poly(glycerol phosphate) polymerase [Barrientosiimonas marina]|uniref:CDP-glycerol glycerophosphotransferase family protein n=1 Tax=Lentibacillus kimchii TaxID=1542911 RepID=A0ABW2UVF6_9BACI